MREDESFIFFHVVHRCSLAAQSLAGISLGISVGYTETRGYTDKLVLNTRTHKPVKIRGILVAPCNTRLWDRNEIGTVLLVCVRAMREATGQAMLFRRHRNEVVVC